MTNESLQAVYLTDREADAVLHDGTAIRIRPVRPDDEPRLRAFFLGLWARSRVLRSTVQARPCAAGRATTVGYGVPTRVRADGAAVRGEHRSGEATTPPESPRASPADHDRVIQAM
ncbi:MAG TPA: hypothetical protein VEP50_02990 [bacterium]|nr:hypothetical protein [bacterium]